MKTPRPMRNNTQTKLETVLRQILRVTSSLFISMPGNPGLRLLERHLEFASQQAGMGLHQYGVVIARNDVQIDFAGERAPAIEWILHQGRVLFGRVEQNNPAVVEARAMRRQRAFINVINMLEFFQQSILLLDSSSLAFAVRLDPFESHLLRGFDVAVIAGLLAQIGFQAAGFHLQKASQASRM